MAKAKFIGKCTEKNQATKDGVTTVRVYFQFQSGDEGYTLSPLNGCYLTSSDPLVKDRFDLGTNYEFTVNVAP